jgi:hypothetical protein
VSPFSACLALPNRLLVNGSDIAICKDRFCSGCSGTGLARSPATADRWIGSPFGPQSAILVYSIHRRSAEAGIERSIGSVGDAKGKSLGHTINGHCKTEMAHRRDRGATSRIWKWPALTGLIGATAGACLAPHETSRQQRTKRTSLHNATCLISMRKTKL